MSNIMKYYTINNETFLKRIGGIDKVSYTPTQKGQPELKQYPEWSGFAIGANKIYLDEDVPTGYLKINDN